MAKATGHSKPKRAMAMASGRNGGAATARARQFLAWNQPWAASDIYSRVFKN